MKSLYQFLIEEKKYTSEEAIETFLRHEKGIYIPEEIEKDIKEWNKKKSQQIN